MKRRDATRQLIEALAAGDPAQVEAAIASGADVNALDTENENTVLMSAVETGDLAVVRALVEAGADVNVYVQGDCALSLAVSLGYRAIFDYLGPVCDDEVRRDSTWTEPEADNGRPTPALYKAVEEGRLEEVRKLLAAGADANSRGGGNEYALDEALRRGHQDIALDLIRSGAGVNPVGGNANRRSPVQRTTGISPWFAPWSMRVPTSTPSFADQRR